MTAYRLAPTRRSLMRAIRSALVAVVVATGIFLHTPAALPKKPKPVPCDPGRFIVTTSPSLTGGQTTSPEQVVIEEKTLAVTTGCAPTSVKVKAVKNFTRITAVWKKGCAGLKGKATLRAKITAPACSVMDGTFNAPKTHVRTPFRAERFRCGDGEVNTRAGEQCEATDTTACGPDSTCDTTSCKCVAGTTTTSTSTSTSTSGTSTSTSTSTVTTTHTTASTSVVTTTSTSSRSTVVVTTTSTSTTSSTIGRCGDGLLNGPTEECDPPSDGPCPGECQTGCKCPGACAAPTITGITPLSGSAGTEVTISGTNLDCEIRRTVACGVVGVTITSASATSLKAIIPPGLEDCLLTVATRGGTATASSGQRFDVTTSRSFALRVLPDRASVAQGTSTTVTVSIDAPAGFGDTVRLQVSGLPAGVTAALSSPTVTRASSATLTLTGADDAALGTTSVTVGATADIDGLTVVRTAQVAVTTDAGGKTSLVGRVRFINGPPLEGVRLLLGGKTAFSDAGGNFRLTDLPEGEQYLTVDVTPVNPVLPIYGVTVNLVRGRTTQLDSFSICPPLSEQRYTPLVSTMAEQVITDDANVPGFEFHIPPATILRGWDGNLKTKMGVERLQRDQLPMPPPAFAAQTFYQPFFGTPMGGLPDPPAPIGVSMPNEEGLPAGRTVELWYYDAAPLPGVKGEWKLAGNAHVSEDGKQIVSDPGVGIRRFCGVCGTTCIRDAQDKQKNTDPKDPKTADPVNLAIGQMVSDKTDLVLPGRIPAVLHRVHNPFDPLGGIAGIRYALANWALSIEVVLLEDTASTRRLILPGNSRFQFGRTGSSGPFTNSTHVQFAGATITPLTNAQHELRFKDGTRWLFAPTRIAGTSFLASEIDRNGNQLTIERNASGEITRLIEPAGRALSFRYESGHLVEVTDPIARSVRYGFGSFGLQTVTDTAGGVTRYEYDSAGRVLSVTDPRNITYIRNEYSPSTGNLLRQIQADGGEWKFFYDLSVSCIGGSLPFCTDTGPQICCQPPPVAAGGRSARTVIVPNLPGPYQFQEGPGHTLSNGYVDPRTITVVSTTVVDPRENATTYRGNDVTIDALGNKTTVTRDARGAVQSVTDALGRVTRFEYDDVGSVTKIADPAGGTRTFEYNGPFHQVVRSTDALGHVNRASYDQSGNITAVIDPLGNRSQVDYDAQGSPLVARDPLGDETHFTYDSSGNLVEIVDPLGNSIHREYDRASRLIKESGSAKNTTRFSYSPLNQVTEIVDTLGGTTRFRYDANGNLLGVADALNHETSFEYDSMDRQVARVDALGQRSTARYDAAGNQTELIARRGTRMSTTYDSLNRPVRTDFDDGSTIGAEYDPVGRVTRMEDATDGAVLFEYDLMDRIVKETNPRGSLAWTFDAAGRRISLAGTGQYPVQFFWDDASRLVGIARGAQNIGFSYDAVGRRTRLDLPNGITGTWEWDAGSRLTGLSYRRNGSIVGDVRYTYDSTGARTTVSGSLARPSLPAPASRTSYDAANEQLTFGDSTVSYDADGNVVAVDDSRGHTSLSWDSKGHLTRVVRPGLNASYTYDALGRRVAQENNGAVVHYQHDRANVLQEIRSGAVVPITIGTSIDEVLMRGDDEFHLLDALGTTLALADQSGSITTRYAYDPFGKTNAVGSFSRNPFQFTGRENDPTGFYFYRARYYSPDLSRFLSQDPLGFTGGDPNLYPYVRNDPANLVDPSGEAFIPCVIGSAVMGGLVGGGVKVTSNLLSGRKDIWEGAGEATLDGLLWGAVGGLTCGIGPALSWLRGGDELIQVTRWGRAGLQSEDWVMVGGKRWWNYFFSGKWQFFGSNEFAWPSTGKSSWVPKSSLQLPKEATGNALTDWIKGRLLSQRIYRP